MKMFAHECPQCDGEGTVEEIDNVRTKSWHEEPTFKTTVCDVCHGDGEAMLDEQAHAFVVALCTDYMAKNVTTKAIIAEQRQHIATLEALLKTERDRVAKLERHISNETEVVA